MARHFKFNSIFKAKIQKAKPKVQIKFKFRKIQNPPSTLYVLDHTDSKIKSTTPSSNNHRFRIQKKKTNKQTNNRISDCRQNSSPGKSEIDEKTREIAYGLFGGTNWRAPNWNWNFVNQTIVEEYKLKVEPGERERERERELSGVNFVIAKNFWPKWKERKKRENIKCDYGLDRNCLIECIL